MAETCSDGGQSVLSNLSRMPLLFCAPDKTTEFSRLSRYGMTYAPLQADLGVAASMWCLEASHARTYQPQDLAQGLTEKTADCGQKWPALLAKCSPGSFLWKTVQCSLLEDSVECLETWPDSGMTRSGDAFQRPPLALHIEETESGYLPTPSGTSNHGKNHVCGRLDEWGGSSNPWRGTDIGRTRSPSFEEWMMGWPVSWSALTPLETVRFREWQQQHSLCCDSEQDGEPCG